MLKSTKALLVFIIAAQCVVILVTQATMHSWQAIAHRWEDTSGRWQAVAGQWQAASDGWQHVYYEIRKATDDRIGCR